jgi:hypothetical protein
MNKTLLTIKKQAFRTGSNVTRTAIETCQIKALFCHQTSGYARRNRIIALSKHPTFHKNQALIAKVL